MSESVGKETSEQISEDPFVQANKESVEAFERDNTQPPERHIERDNASLSG